LDVLKILGKKKYPSAISASIITDATIVFGISFFDFTGFA